MPTHERSAAVRIGSILWALIPLLTFGFAGFVPALHAAIKLHRRLLWVEALAYGVLTYGSFAFFGSPQEGQTDTIDPVSGVAVGVVLVTMLIATVRAFVIRRQVFGLLGAGERAMGTALAARRQRHEARALAERDPGLALELRIGRPDLAREYEDGGLVDVNRVPAPVLAHALGLMPTDAESIVALRERLGRLSSVDEITAYTDVNQQRIDEIRDRVVVL